MKRLLAGLVMALLLVPTAGAQAAALPATGGATLQKTWSSDQVRAPEARLRGRSGAGITVAVLDTWIDGAHPDFEGRVLVGADCVGGTCVPGERSDQCDHGTHVAGTLASSSFGIAPRARILPIRVLAYDPASGDCTGRPSDVAAGIAYAVSQGAKVLNLSLGADVPGLASGPLPKAVAAAVAQGVVVVFSAGNGNVPVADVYGGKALVVAATGPSGALASYSQRGQGVSIAAPGGDALHGNTCTREDCITSLYPGGKYAVAAGTSMAAPVVSAVAAMLFAQDPNRSGQAVRAQILRTARSLAGAGAGLIDAAAALGVTAPPPPLGAPTAPVTTKARAVLPQPSPLPLELQRRQEQQQRPIEALKPVGADALPTLPVAIAALLLALSLAGWLVGRTISFDQPAPVPAPNRRRR